MTSDVGDPTPEDYQPALTWWSHTWRALLVLLIGGVVWLTVAEDQNDTRFLLDVGGGLLAFILMWWRRRFPWWIAVITTVLSAFSGWAAGPSTLATVSLASRRDLRQVIGIGVFAFVCAEIFVRVNPGDAAPWWVAAITDAIAIGATLGWGMYIGSRRALIWTLRARAERAEAEKELRASQSRMAERSRIAREMHDVLAHRISQISMRAGAMHYREDLDSSALREEAGVIRESAHQALTELRQVLGVLRDSSGDLLDRPQPTYHDLADLIEEATAGGQRIVAHDAVEGELPDPTGRTVYRIVQECLTNARKHAPKATVHVSLTGSEEDGVRVSVRNPRGFAPAGTPASGLGLIGLTERVELAGGRITAGLQGEDFCVSVSLPWTS